MERLPFIALLFIVSAPLFAEIQVLRPPENDQYLLQQPPPLKQLPSIKKLKPKPKAKPTTRKKPKRSTSGRSFLTENLKKDSIYDEPPKRKIKKKQQRKSAASAKQRARRAKEAVEIALAEQAAAEAEAALAVAEENETKKKRRKRRRKKRRRRPKKEPPLDLSDEGAVDLSTLDTNTGKERKIGAYDYPKPAPSAGPVFKAYFDLLLLARPRVKDFTFTTLHTLLLVDFIPNDKLEFGFEVEGFRYYELKWKINEKLRLKIGKIWIPFGDMNPHNTFGGFINNSETMTPTADGGQRFLPDIWADLGVGATYTLFEKNGFQLIGDIYLVNGFGQTTDVDDVNGAVGAPYPSFAEPGGRLATDNNKDKAVGARLYGLINRNITLGVSFYTGVYSNQEPADPSLVPDSLKLTMLGINALWRINRKFEVRMGYITMNVDLQNFNDVAQFAKRNAVYGEVKYNINDRWSVLARGGGINNDDRVDDPNDKTIVGAKVIWNVDTMIQLSLEHHKDIRDVTGVDKYNRDYTALRFVVNM